jgi:hypothetical protein
MRRFRLRLLTRVNIEALLIASGQNLKRLLKKRGWGRRPCPAEAVFALFLTSCWWLICLSLESVSVSSSIGSLYHVGKRKYNPPTDELCRYLFQQAGILSVLILVLVSAAK